MLTAIGNTVANAQNYTNFIPAESITLTQQQGNTHDTLKLSVRDPLSTYPIMAEDEVHLLDETDPNGWPSVNLIANGSFEGTYVSGVAPSWNTTGTGLPTLSSNSSSVFGTQAQRAVFSNQAVGTSFLFQNVVLPVNENGVRLTALPYYFSLWTYAAAPLNNVSIQINVSWLDAALAGISGSASVVISNISTAWQRVSVSGLAPATAFYAQPLVRFTTSSATNSGTVLFDGAQLEYATYAAHSSGNYLPAIDNPTLQAHPPALTAPSTTALTVFATNSAATSPGLTTTAGLLLSTGASVGLTNQNSLLGTATGWGELWARGNAGAWAAAGSAGAPSGHGLVFDGTTLDTKTLVAGNWAQLVRLALGATATITATILGRWWLYDTVAETYTALGTSTLSAQTLNATNTTYTLPTISIPATYVGPQQRLYVDVWLNVTANANANGTLTIKLNDLGTDAGKGGSNQSLATQGYQSLPNVVVDGWFDSANVPGLRDSTGVLGGRSVQNVTMTNVMCPGNLLTANQSDVETDISGFYVGGATSTGQGPFSGGGITISRDTTTGAALFHGVGALKCVSDGLGTFQAMEARIPVSGQFSPGGTYTFSSYIYSVAGGPTIRYYCQADTGSIGGSGSITLSAGLNRYSFTTTLPNPLVQTYIALRWDTGGVAQAITLWMDGLMIEPGAQLDGWMLGSTDQSLFTRGIAQDMIPFNPNATYTLTMTYQVTAALTDVVVPRIGLNCEDVNGNPLGGADTIAGDGPAGEGVSSSWRTITLRVGPNTPFLPPVGAAQFKLFCGLVCNTTAEPVSGAIAIDTLSLVADPLSQQPTGYSVTALAAGMYPTPYIDPVLAGNLSSSVWLDRDVTGLYYRALRFFGGFLKKASLNYTQGSERVWDLEASDFGTLFDEVIVTTVIRSATLSLSQSSALTNANAGLPDNLAINQVCTLAHQQGYLQGMDWTTHVSFLSDIPAMAFNFTTARDVLSAIADVTVAAYWTDPYKNLWYQAALSTSAPYGISMTPDLLTTFPMTDWTFEYDSTQTRNVMILQGQTQVSAPQSLTFHGARGMTNASALVANTTYTQISLTGLPNALEALVLIGFSESGNTQQATSTQPIPVTANWTSGPAAVTATSTFANGTYRVAYSATYATFPGSQETPVNTFAAVAVTGTTQSISVPTITGLQANVTAINYYASTAAGGSTLGLVKTVAVVAGAVPATNVQAPGGGTLPKTAWVLPTVPFTPGNAFSTSASANIMGFTVNGGLPIFTVSSVVQNGVALAVGLSSVNSSTAGNFDVYSDPQPAQITYDSVRWPSGPPTGQAVVITYSYESPVMVRLFEQGGTRFTNGRLIAFYQQVNGIQSNADAIDQANALLAQFGAPQPIGSLTLWTPPAPTATPIHPGQFIKITHPPSLSTSSPVSFQIIKVETRFWPNNAIQRNIDVGYVRPDLSKMMAQVTQDASHLQADLNATSILSDILSLQDGWVMTDHVVGSTANVGVWSNAPANTIGGAFSGNHWSDGTAWS